MVTQSPPIPLHRNILDKMFLFVQRYPFTVWGLALVMVLFLGGVAFKGLINPGPVEEEAAQPELVQKQQTTTVREHPDTEKAMDLWLFGAIALGGALGSFLISQQLEQLDPKRNQPKRLKRQAPVKRPQPKPQPAAIINASKNRQAAPAKQRQPVAPAAASDRPSRVAARPGARPVQALAQPVVTVVPAEESHPLDWGEASLAEMMDLRKRRPLSSLL